MERELPIIIKDEPVLGMAELEEKKGNKIIFVPAPGEWWWDGPERFQKINRNNVSSVQKEKIWQMIKMHFRDTGDRGIELNAYDWAKEFPDDSFNYLLSYHSMEHIPVPLSVILQEYARIVCPGGWLGIIMPDKTQFQHSQDEIDPFLIAYNETTPDEMRAIIDKLGCFNILALDTNKNNLDFDVILEVKKNWTWTCPSCGATLYKKYPWDKVVCLGCGWIWE